VGEPGGACRDAAGGRADVSRPRPPPVQGAPMPIAGSFKPPTLNIPTVSKNKNEVNN